MNNKEKTPKPKMAGDVKNLFHLVNRASKVLEEAGVDEEKIRQLRNRCLHENPADRITFDEAKRIVAEYVDVVDV